MLRDDLTVFGADRYVFDTSCHLPFPWDFPTPDELFAVTARNWGYGLGLKLSTVLPKWTDRRESI